MNAGAHGSEMKDIVKTVTYIDRNGEIHKINNEQEENLNIEIVCLLTMNIL